MGDLDLVIRDRLDRSSGELDLTRRGTTGFDLDRSLGDGADVENTEDGVFDFRQVQQFGQAFVHEVFITGRRHREGNASMVRARRDDGHQREHPFGHCLDELRKARGGRGDPGIGCVVEDHELGISSHLRLTVLPEVPGQCLCLRCSRTMLNYPLLYVEHLSDRDLALIAHATGSRESVGELRSRLHEDPTAVEDLLADEELFDAIFGSASEVTNVQVGITPFLVFGVLVNKVSRDLAEAAFIPEWVGSGQRLPVFDVETLRVFVDDGVRRYFLIEFLASFTKVASGSVWVKTRRGYRRRRFSELDPVSLAEMVDGLPAPQRAGGYRRLGDVSLFLCGVFPDHTSRNGIGEMARARLARSAGVDDELDLAGDEIRFFEVVGPSWYGKAIDSASIAVGVGPTYLRDVAERFTDARRFLNLLSDRYLHDFDTGLMHPVA